MKKLLIALVSLPVLLVAGVAVFIATLNPNDYREPLTKALSEQTGRRIELKGDIKINLTSHGIMLSVNEVAVGNPAWASRPDMAKIGRFEMGLALPPLLRKRVVVTGVTLANSDLMLESSGGDRHNWDIGLSAAQNSASSGATPPGKAADAKPSAPIAWQINQLTVKDSAFSMRDSGGKVTKIDVSGLSVAPGNGGVMANFDGRVGEVPVKMTARTDRSDLLGASMRPLALDLEYGGYMLKAEGKAGLSAKKADFQSFSLKSGASEIHGSLAVDWSGSVPKVKAQLASDRLAPQDFQTAAADASAAPANGKASSSAPGSAAEGADRVFSDTPLGFGALRQAEADLDLSIADLQLGALALSQVNTKIALHGGQLNIAPLTAVAGGGSLNGQVQISAASAPAKLGATLFLKNVELADLLKFRGAESMIEGKAAVDLNLTSSGDSIRDLAGNLGGTLSVISAGGDVVSRSQETILSGLAELLAPGTSGNAAMNCMVARFTAAGGIVRDNGILVDTATATVAGRGGMDLRNETLDFVFRAKPKGVNVGGLIPPARIGGTLSKPSYGIHAESVVRNVAGLLLGNGAALNDPIPDVVAQAGQNACLAALSNPQAQKTAPENGAVQDIAGKANKAVQDLGGKLMKGLFGQ